MDIVQNHIKIMPNSSKSSISFSCKPFTELSLEELYKIMQIRQAVFVVEQDCAYLDADDKDQDAWHVMGFSEEGQLLAYTRLLPMGISYQDYVSIGRVVSSPNARGLGAGRKAMQFSLTEMERIFGNSPIKLSAQSYLIKFYESLGFECVGAEYLEDGIPHIAMIKNK